MLIPLPLQNISHEILNNLEVSISALDIPNIDWTVVMGCTNLHSDSTLFNHGGSTSTQGSSQRRQVEPNSMWQHRLTGPLHTAYGNSPGNSQTKLILNYFKRGSTLNLNGFSVKGRVYTNCQKQQLYRYFQRKTKFLYGRDAPITSAGSDSAPINA